MKRIVLAILAVSVIATGAMAQSVVNTEHDLSAAIPTSQEVCVFCHTPHQPTGVTQQPLWNHTMSTVGTYGVYSSDTLNADMTGAEIGGGTTASNLCMSCHDGTIGIGSLYNEPNLATGGEETPNNSGTLISGNANLGTDLSNDHPVNFTYNAALVSEDGGLKAPPSSLLFAGTVQCASCHDAHDDQFYPFLTATNVQSALCLQCHNK